MKWATTLGLALILLACSPSDSEPKEILVFAAASLGIAMEEIGAEFEAVSNARVTFSFGGSQTLAQQVAGGAPADIIVTAGELPMQFLIERNLVRSEPVDLLTNKLVVVVQKGADPPKTLQALIGAAFPSIAIADPNLAPAGDYAREALKKLGLWTPIEKKLVFGPDVRSTLAYVESGNSDAALVYETDARASDRVEVLDIVPVESYSPIVYPAALIHNAPNESDARLFLEFLEDQKAKKIFLDLGFQPAW
ncbi:MAG: molybdate ABC transporter substrate-binding protein [SAR202 cluster bacterium]|nr:molybdate ABC transporter substrate-binding protein [SAR202 cluster bacterium]